MLKELTAPGGLRWQLKSWARYRDIVWYRTLAGLKSEARRNYLGYVWFLLEPAITTATMYLVYVLIFQSGGPARVAMLLVGTIVWQWFESSVMQGMQGIRGKLHIMLHFTLPKYIFPLVGIFTNTWKFLCVFVVLLGACALCGFPPTAALSYLPLVLAAQLIFIIGLTLPLAIAVAYMNDVTTVTSAIFRLLMFLSGVFFSASQVPDAARFYFYLNPMAGIIEAYRSVMLEHAAPNLYALLYAILCGLILGLIGLFWCAYVDGKILKRVNG